MEGILAAFLGFLLGIGAFLLFLEYMKDKDE